MEEKLVYFKENGADYYLVGDKKSNKETAHIGYWAKIQTEPVTESLRIVVPETAEGKPVELVIIHIDEGREDDPDIPPIEYLYIPSGVRHLRFDVSENYLLNGINVEISPDNRFFRAIENNIYSRDMKTLYYIFSPGECFEVPAGVEIIQKSAGNGLDELKKLVIPKSVKEIGKKAFLYCMYLEDVDITAENIGAKAFSGCSVLSRARLNCRSIGKGAFSDCWNLKALELINTEIIEKDAFFDCDTLSEVKLPDTLRKIGDSAFWGTMIYELVIPPNVRYLGDSLFGGSATPDLDMTVYSDKGEVFFKISGDPISVLGSKITVRSLETGKTLFEIIRLDSRISVFTERGIDFTEYDKIFKEDHRQAERRVLYAAFKAAMTRLEYPYQLTEDAKKTVSEYVRKHAGCVLLSKIKNGELDAERVREFPYMEFISDNELLAIIDITAGNGNGEITAVLMWEMNERRKRE